MQHPLRGVRACVALLAAPLIAAHAGAQTGCTTKDCLEPPVINPISFTPLVTIVRGRAGLQRVALRQVRTGRGALKRRSNVQIQGGRSMVGVGGSMAAAAYAGDATISSGLEQALILDGGDPEGSVLDWIPWVGTARSAIAAGASCFRAARAQWGR